MRLLAGCAVVFVIVGASSATGSEWRPAASLAQAHDLVRAAFRLENSAMRLLQRHDGVSATSKLRSAEGSLRHAVAALKRAPVAAVDQQGISEQLRAALQLDGEALRVGPHRALTQLAVAGRYKRTALEMLENVMQDGGRVPE